MRISDWSSDVCSSDLEKPAIGTLQVIALCFHDMLAPCLRRDSDGIEQTRDAGRILEIRIVRKDVKEPFSGHFVALGIGDGSMRVVDRKSVVEGTSVSVRVDLGGRRIINKKKNTEYKQIIKEHDYVQENRF